MGKYKNMLYALYYKEVRAGYIRKNMKTVKYKGDKLRIMLDKMQWDRVKNVYVKMVADWTKNEWMLETVW